jgi:hypothetical protein
MPEWPEKPVGGGCAESVRMSLSESSILSHPSAEERCWFHMQLSIAQWVELTARAVDFRLRNISQAVKF